LQTNGSGQLAIVNRADSVTLHQFVDFQELEDGGHNGGDEVKSPDAHRDVVLPTRREGLLSKIGRSGHGADDDDWQGEPQTRFLEFLVRFIVHISVAAGLLTVLAENVFLLRVPRFYRGCRRPRHPVL